MKVIETYNHIYNQVWNADGTQPQSIMLDTGSKPRLEIWATATKPTTFKLELSNDGVNWVLYYQSPSPETGHTEVIRNCFRYARLSSGSTGTVGTVTLILSAK